ncbi:MAG TPA: 2-dehydropantoate 2-reductase [Stellaceae bacterium]|nr:2-dehydropantoate 2-reductase [Stellaceae bacterium]
MRFLIVGAGGLGGYYGGMLVKGGADVAFLVRPRRQALLAARGLVINSADGDFLSPVKTLRAGEINGPYDVVLLACKAYDLDGAIAAIAPAMGPQSAVLPVLNGINHIAVLEEHFGAGRVLGGVSYVRAEVTQAGEILHHSIAGFGRTLFGELSGERSARSEEIRRAFAAGGVECTFSDDILAEMWAKFCGYAVVAAMAVLTRARAGEIAAAPAGAAFVAAVFEECARVTAAEGYRPPAALSETIRGIYATPGSIYAPSILADMESGGPTEGEHTIGDLVHRADRHALAVPILRAALCTLQICEVRRTARG